MLGVDSAASMLRCCPIARNSDRPISIRVAQFTQFRAERLINMRLLVDSLIPSTWSSRRIPPAATALPSEMEREDLGV